MSKHGQPMSQTLAQMHLNELKMNDPKLNKIFDKLKKGDKVKLKTSSTMSKGSDFVEYIVKSKNVVNKGRVEKITLATVGNEKAVKKFLYRRDGKVTFAMGDMAASIDDIKEKYSVINHEIIEEIEVEELDEGMAYKFAAVDKKGLVIGFASKESDAKDMARRNKGRVVTLTKPLPDNKKSDMMINRPLPDEMDKFPTNTSATQGKRMEEDEIDEGKMKDRLMKAQDLMGPSKNREQGIEFVMKGLKVSKKEATKLVDAVLDMMMNNEVEIDEASARDDAMRAMGRGRRVDPADVDEPSASDADKKSAMKNMIMQMRQSLDSKGSKPIEFEDGKKQKVDPKILTLLTKAHDQIQKPRDKEQFVKMISKSYRDMLKVSKMVSKQLRMGEEIVLDEGFSPKEIKMAIGIASDPRYKGGNYTGAFKAIEKIKKGLASHPQVAAVLKRQNENLDEKYDLYHKTFSDAMQHAYDYAKKKLVLL